MAVAVDVAVVVDGVVVDVDFVVIFCCCCCCLSMLYFVVAIVAGYCPIILLQASRCNRCHTAVCYCCCSVLLSVLLLLLS